MKYIKGRFEVGGSDPDEARLRGSVLCGEIHWSERYKLAKIIATLVETRILDPKKFKRKKLKDPEELLKEIERKGTLE